MECPCRKPVRMPTEWRIKSCAIFPQACRRFRFKVDVRPLRETVVADVRPVLQMLFLAVAIVLLIACVNVSSLLLVRAIRQRREYAVRVAIGASCGRIIRESLVEGLLLSMAGGLLGLVFAAIAIRTTLHLMPDSMPRIDSVSMNPIVAAFALVVAVAAGVLCSLAPAFAALRINLIESLKEGAQIGGNASHSWLRSALVVSAGCHRSGAAHPIWRFPAQLTEDAASRSRFSCGPRSDCRLPTSFGAVSHHSVCRRVYRAVIDHLSSKPGVIACSHQQRGRRIRCFPAVCVHRRGRFRGLREAEIRCVYQRLWGLLRRYGHSSARRPNLYDARRFQRAARGNCEPIDGQRLLAGPGALLASVCMSVTRGRELPWAAVIGVCRRHKDASRCAQHRSVVHADGSTRHSVRLGNSGNLSGPPEWIHHNALSPLILSS